MAHLPRISEFDRRNFFARELAIGLFEGILERQPAASGLQHTIDQIEAGRAAERCAAMLRSREFTNRFLAGL